jgi:hypothetical protein
MTRQEGIEKMKVFTRRQALPQLAGALLLLDAKPKLDDAERLTRAVLMDVICEKSPEADAAFDAWCDSDDNGPVTAAEAILAALPVS